MKARAASLLIAATAIAGCGLLPGSQAPLRPEDCFGKVAYSFAGWTTLAVVQPGSGPTDEPVYAMITRDEVTLTVSPPAPDGSTTALIGRGACWTSEDGGETSKAAFGPTRSERSPASS